MGKKFYAVKNGRKIGVFESWDECKKQVSGFSGAEYKSFLNLKEAQDFTKNGQEAVIDLSSEDECIIAYVDGSYEEIKKAFSYGIVILEDNKIHIDYGKSSAKEYIEMRNVAGEILAATKAMEYVSNIQCENKVLTIYHDYEGIEKWCTGEWEAKKDKTKEYIDQYMYYSKLMKINFKKVKSHSGDKYNDIADELAKYALNEDMLAIISNIEYHSCDSHNIESFETKRQLNISPGELIEKINKICTENDMNMRIKDGTDVNTDKHIILYFDKNYLNSEIHLHVSGKGLTISINQGKCKELNCLVLHNLMSKYNINKVEEKQYTYAGLTDEKLLEIVENLKLFDDDEKYEFIINNPAQNMKYSFNIKSNSTGEKVYVYIYTNNNLEIRGKKYLLWEDVCYIIEKTLNISLDDIIGRINVGVDLKFNHDNVDVCDNDLKLELGEELMSFMYTHDYNVILSVKCSLEQKIRIPDYGIYIDPLTKALEGYLKKVIANLEICRRIDMSKPNWNLAEVFEKNNRSLKQEYHNLLNNDDSIRVMQLNILKCMCDKMWDIRNPINHSDHRGTLSYNNYEDAIKEFNSIIDLIKKSYNILIS